LIYELKNNQTAMFHAEPITKDTIYTNLMKKALSKPQVNDLLDILSNIIKGDSAYYISTDDGEFIMYLSELKNKRIINKKLPKKLFKQS